ncbi:MAG: aminopeptidase P family N-terminal domain-containing protein [Lentisphaerae bacterium]|nr:aminopeptidase P family N-terminal domain-containing protein [Lentisphaerota bacterium]
MNETGWREKDDYTIREIRGYLEREKLDAFIPWKPAHIAYLTNYFDKVHVGIPWDEMIAMLVIPRDSDAFLAGATLHWAGLPEDGTQPWWLREFHPVWESSAKTFEKTIALIRKKRMDKARIGVELKWMPAMVYRYFANALPHVEFVPADSLIPQLRLVKTKREQALMKHAAETGLRCMEAYMQALRNGATVREAELARARRALDFGGEFVGGPQRVSWTGGTDVTPAWWDASVRRRYESSPIGKTWNDSPFDSPILVTHLETLYQFYYSDLAWHEFIGPEPAGAELFHWGNKTVSHDGGSVVFKGDGRVSYDELCGDFLLLRRVQREAIRTIKPGMDQWQAKQAVDDYLASDREARERITMYFLHSLGLEIHEEPILAARKVFDGAAPVPVERAIRYYPGAVMSSEWFTNYWTVEEPFLMTETGWEPLIELKGLVSR